MNFKATVCGCDDETSVELTVNDAELGVLLKFAETVNQVREYGCMPGITVQVDGEPVVGLED